jgi:amino acid adenylation domain-containing protein
MTIDGLLDQLSAKGLRVAAKDGRLVLYGDASALDAALRAAITEHNAELLAIMSQARAASLPEVAPDAAVPLTSTQRAIFNEYRIVGGNAYHMPLIARIDGDLNVAALNEALIDLGKRYPVLTSRFFESEDGELLQQAVSGLSIPVGRLRIDEDELEQTLRELVDRPFALDRGEALRATIVEGRGGSRHLCVVAHHVAADGWSGELLKRELSELYRLRVERAAAPPAPAALFASYAQKIRDASATHRTRDEAFWRSYLDSRPPNAELALLPGEAGTSCTFDATVPKHIARAVEQLAESARCTFYTVLLAAAGIVLGRLSGQDEMLIACPSANRLLPGSDEIVGMFLDNFPLLVKSRSSSPLIEVLQKLSEDLLEASEHAHLSLAEIARLSGRDSSSNALPQASVNLLDYASHPLLFEGAQVAERIFDPIDAKYPITLYADHRNSDFRIRYHAQTSHFSAEALRIVHERLIEMLASMAAEPHRAFDGLGRKDESPSLKPPLPPSRSTPCRFREVAARAPQRTAIVGPDGEWTYRELGLHVDAVHEALLRLEVKRGDRIAIVATRNRWLPVAILACLQAGCPYVVLDALVPQARHETALRRLGPRLMLIAAEGEEIVAPAALAPAHDVAGLAADFAGAEPPYTAPHPDEIACLTMTSGTTGEPRVVEGRHAALVAQFDDGARRYGIGPDDRFAALSGLMSDPLQRDLFTPLCCGASVAIPRQTEIHPDRLAGWIAESGVTILNLTPPMAAYVTASDAAPQCRVRWVFLCGDVLTWAETHALEQALVGAGIVNLYGMTESQRGLTHYLCRSPGADRSERREGLVPLGARGAGARLAVLDPTLRAVEPWEVGEIVIIADDLACGYADRPADTAMRFVPGPEGTRWLRTGDRGRLLPSGDVAYLGRGEEDVNIRGFRFSLSEVDHQVQLHPDTSASRTLIENSPTNGPRLVTYWVGSDALTQEALQAYLRQRLPAAMVPARAVKVDSLPLNAAGKIDVARLRETQSDPQIGQAIVGEPAASVAAVWKQLLGRDVTLESAFFSLGGHSLLAIRLAERLRGAMGRSYPVARLLENGTLGECIAYYARDSDNEPEEAAEDLEEPPIVPAEDASAPFPLTEVQQAYWLGRTSDFAFGRVATATYVEYRMREADPARIQAALQRLLSRHAMLRTVVTADGMQQTLQGDTNFELPVQDLRAYAPDARAAALEAWRSAMENHIFDPGEWPLFAVRLSLLGRSEAILHVSVDLLVVDFWSSQVLLREFLILYRDPTAGLPSASFPFSDYAWRNHRRKQGAGYAKARKHWLARIGEMPQGPQLPLRPAPSAIQPKFVRRGFRLTADRWDRLTKRASERGVTRAALLLTAYAEALNLWSETSRFLVNLTIFDRPPLHKDIELTVGDFTSLVLVEADMSSGTFSDKLHRVQRELITCLENRAFNSVEILREMTRARGDKTPLAPVVLTYTLDLPEAANEVCADLEESYRNAKSSQVLIDHTTGRDGDDILLFWNAVDDLFPPELVETMFGAYCALIERLSDPDSEWDSIRAADWAPRPSPRRLAYNDTPLEPSDELIHEPFLAMCEAAPDRAALIADAQSWTYAELRGMADRLRNRLSASGVVRGEYVAVMLPKGWRQVVAVLGTVWAGGAYLPIAPDLPEGRVANMLAAANVRTVIADTETSQRYGSLSGFRILEPIAEDAGPVSPIPQDLTADDPSYAIYTSGSTGAPKAVTITHRAAMSTIRAVNALWGLGPEDRVFALSSLSFDLSVYDIFGTLAAGAALVVPSADDLVRPGGWLALLQRHAATIWNSAPGLLQIFLEGLPDNGAPPLPLRLVMLSGDWIPLSLPAALSRHAPTAEVVSLGGATEAAIWSIYHPISEVRREWRSIPYGRPLAGQRVHVLKPDLTPTPDWAVGEIHISGAGLAREYLGDTERTQKSFIVRAADGERLYATGDLGRYVPEGWIDILGRRDGQVKLSGRRIELGEVDAALERITEIGSGLAVVRETGGGTKQIVAFVTEQNGLDPAASPWRPADDERQRRWREALARVLPEYVIPALFVSLKQLPLNSNGKVDRLRLAQHPLETQRAETQQRRDRPLVGREQEIELIWRDLLQLNEPAKPWDSFLELGGNSLLAMRCLNRMNRDYGLALNLADIYTATRLEDLAGLVEAALTLKAMQKAAAFADCELEGGEL